MPGVTAPGVDSTYAWWRLAASVTLSTVGGIGMWCLVVALPSIQQDLGVSRADISFAYTMTTLGFFAGGVTWGKLVDMRGIVLTAILSATGLAAGFALAPGHAREIVVLARPVEAAHGELLAFLADGEAWSSSALALALGASQRTVQRALDALAAEGRVQAVGQGRARRWMTPPAPGFTTTLLLPAPLPGD